MSKMLGGLCSHKLGDARVFSGALCYGNSEGGCCGVRSGCGYVDDGKEKFSLSENPCGSSVEIWIEAELRSGELRGLFSVCYGGVVTMDSCVASSWKFWTGVRDRTHPRGNWIAGVAEPTSTAIVNDELSHGTGLIELVHCTGLAMQEGVLYDIDIAGGGGAPAGNDAIPEQILLPGPDDPV